MTQLNSDDQPENSANDKTVVSQGAVPKFFLVKKNAEPSGPYHWKLIVEWHEIGLLEGFSYMQSQSATGLVSEIVSACGIPPTIAVNAERLRASVGSAPASVDEMDSLYFFGFPEMEKPISAEIAEHVRSRLTLSDAQRAAEDLDFPSPPFKVEGDVGDDPAKAAAMTAGFAVVVEKHEPRNPKPLIIGGAVLAVLLIGVGAWYFTQNSAEDDLNNQIELVESMESSVEDVIETSIAPEPSVVSEVNLEDMVSETKTTVSERLGEQIDELAAGGVAAVVDLVESGPESVVAAVTEVVEVEEAVVSAVSERLSVPEVVEESFTATEEATRELVESVIVASEDLNVAEPIEAMETSAAIVIKPVIDESFQGSSSNSSSVASRFEAVDRVEQPPAFTPAPPVTVTPARPVQVTPVRPAQRPEPKKEFESAAPISDFPDFVPSF